VGALIAVVAVVVLAAFVIVAYNRMVARRQAVDNSWAQIDVALRRRHDLIPPLVEAVKGYASHERGTFERVAETRAAAISASGPPARATAEGRLATAVGGLMTVAEAYPQLEATRNFSQLAEQLSQTEDQIQITRRVYNDTVETYNTLIQVFPAVIVARLFGFGRREFFDAPPEAEATPEVDLSPAPSAS
jgi:LemA protein